MIDPASPVHLLTFGFFDIIPVSVVKDSDKESSVEVSEYKCLVEVTGVSVVEVSDTFPSTEL